MQNWLFSPNYRTNRTTHKHWTVLVSRLVARWCIYLLLFTVFWEGFVRYWRCLFYSHFLLFNNDVIVLLNQFCVGHKITFSKKTHIFKIRQILFMMMHFNVFKGRLHTTLISLWLTTYIELATGQVVGGFIIHIYLVLFY